MDSSKKTKLIKNFFLKVSPETLESRKSNLETINTPGQRIESTDASLEALANGKILEASQVVDLEAIIHTKYRPAVFVVNDDYSTPPAPWGLFGETTARENIRACLKSIGRIELPSVYDIPYGGTGFVVGEGLIMTNRHVAEIFCRGLGITNLHFKVDEASSINFRREMLPSPDVLNITITEIVMIHPYWDMALLRVDGLSCEQIPLTLSTTHPDDLLDNNIAVIGYPAQDLRNDIDLQNKIFGGAYNIKRLQPGKVGLSRTVPSFTNDVHAMTHDASTLGGNSGSAVIDVNTGEVVALHFAGAYLDANFAVPCHQLAKDSRVVDAGVKFNGTVGSTDGWVQQWANTDPGLSDTPDLVSQGTSVQSQSTDIEGMLGGASSEDIKILDKAQALFNKGLLDNTGFSWQTALAMISASYLAYSDAQEIRDICIKKWGFDTCDFIKTNDTECYVVSTASAVLVSFRGTAGVQDWLRDLTVFSLDTDYGSVHNGFYHGFKQVSAELESVMQSVYAHSKKVILTGHSLGGALATVAAAEWVDQYPISAVYTFGQPAVGKGDFPAHMSQLSGRFFRIVNDDDIVTKVPPTYKHLDKLKKLGEEGQILQETLLPNDESALANDTMSETKFMLFQESLSTDSSSTLEGFLPSFKDHSSIQYIKKITAILNKG